MKQAQRIPSYRLHKPTCQAVVTLNGKDHYLGLHGTPESQTNYKRTIAEWLQRGSLPIAKSQPSPVAIQLLNNDPSVNELILGYLKHCETYYQRSPSEIVKIKLALRGLRLMYGLTRANRFGPLALKAIQSHLAETLSRRSVNSRVDIIRRLFKWATSNELIPVTVHQAIMTVEGLRKGRSNAKESRKVLPVPDDIVEKTLQFVSYHVAGMIRFQRYTGARSGEVCTMRPCDIERTGEIWQYRPVHHKTGYLDYERIVPIGKKAQEVLKPYLEDCKPDETVFSPRRSMAYRYRELRRSRKTRVQPSQVSRAKHKLSDRFKNSYGPKSYYRAVRFAAERAKVPHWFPHQLRHALATEIRRSHGIEAARAVLGQQHLSVTEIYAQQDATQACNVMKEMG
ncbi:MAG: tyrosine-type recombinase/integrase [Gemmatales bacterium]